MSELVGRTLGPYQIVEEIGSGGMANVYRAVQPSIGREVALKILPAVFLQDKTFLDRFLNEVQVVARLQHPHILPVYDYGEQDGMPYIVMALMSGGTLPQRIQQYPLGLPLDRAADIIYQAAQGIDFAHRQSVIHRDIKPSNLLFDADENVYLGDFGIAKVAEATASVTQGKVMGTPGYMAPELGEPGEPTPAVDIYAFGITIFEMLTGTLPYVADTPMRVMYMHVNQPIPDIHSLRSDLPDDISYIIDRAIAKHPAHRFPTATALATAFRQVVEGSLDELQPSIQSWREGQQIETQEILPASTGHDTPIVPISDFDHSTQPNAPATRSRLPLVVGLGGVLLLIIALSLLGLLSRDPAVPAAGQPSEIPPSDSPTTRASEEVASAVTATPVSLGATVERISGAVNLSADGGENFDSILDPRLLMTGDTVRTGSGGTALLFFTQGVFAQLHADSLMRLNDVESVDDGWRVDVSLLEGRAYHVVLPGGTIEYVVHTPVAVVHVTGTMFWIEEHDEGWCFVPVDGTIRVDVGEDDSDDADDHALAASDQMTLFVEAGGTALIDGCQLSESAALAGGDSPDNVSSAPTDTPSSPPPLLPTVSQPVDPCVDNGGLQWQGTTCVCSGVINHVTICNDGTKWDSPSEVTCQPDPGCGQTDNQSEPGANCGACGDGGGGGACYNPSPGVFVSCYQLYDGCGNICEDVCENVSSC